MDRKELDVFFRKVVPIELERLNNGNKNEGTPTILESDYFLSPYEIIGVHRHERYAEVPSHSHDYIEMNYVWSGKCLQVINGEEILTESGDICILDTQAVHSIGMTGENDIVLNILMRREFFVSAFFTRMTNQGILSEFLLDAVTTTHEDKHYLRFSSHKNPRIREIMENIFLEYYNQDLGTREIIESYMVILFTELLRTYRDHEKDHKKRHKTGTQVFDILAYIEKNYERCSLKSTADHFGFNSQYMTMLLKEKTGKSFLEHVQEQRLIKAKTLLDMTAESVTEIARECGYSNMNFFYKIFRKSYGCTPSQYRKNNT